MNEHIKTSPFLKSATEAQLRAIRAAEWLDPDDSLKIVAEIYSDVLEHDNPLSEDTLSAVAKNIFVAVWSRVSTDREFPARGPIPDAALDLRDELRPKGAGLEWLPDEVIFV